MQPGFGKTGRPGPENNRRLRRERCCITRNPGLHAGYTPVPDDAALRPGYGSHTCLCAPLRARGFFSGAVGIITTRP